ncbi:MAG: hydroxymethylbilane synthase [Xanthomonadales bacterium]|nr:hydroxymethylbilane synthase [Xanthomonadales bacterium]
MSTPQRLRIATRQSALALWQSEHVASRLRERHPALVVELVPMTTRGDQVLDRPLAQIGGKGLFLKELEVAMQAGHADIAVHSLKDVPMELEAGFAIGAILARADPFDAFVSSRFERFDDLPQGARVGTSSLRRQAQLRARRPDLELLDLRGNVNTRLAKLDNGDFDAIILAAAGLQRLGFNQRIRERLAAPGWLPAAAQGAIAIEIREADHAIRDLLSDLHDQTTAIRVEAERAMTRRLQGSCQVPIAAYAECEGERLRLSGLVGDAATGELLRHDAEGRSDAPIALGITVAEALLEAGAGRLLSSLG